MALDSISYTKSIPKDRINMIQIYYFIPLFQFRIFENEREQGETSTKLRKFGLFYTKYSSKNENEAAPMKKTGIRLELIKEK